MRETLRPTADLHADTLLECFLKDLAFSENPCEIDIQKLKAGGARMQCFAAFIPTHGDAARLGIRDDGYTLFHKLTARYAAELEKNRDTLLPVLSAEDMDRALTEDKTGAMLTAEDMGAVLDGHAERLEEAYRAGVRMMTFTWNYENCLGYPNSRDADVMKRGLKPFGFEMLEAAESLGIAADVSHLSDGGFRDIAAHAKKPFAASHSCCRALCDHPRNLSDEMLRALADKGGVAGVNFFGEFLRADAPRYVTPELVTDHILHMLEVGGEDLPALGSDYDGMDSTLAWKDISGTGMLIRALEARGLSDRVIDKICFGNVRRFFREIM